MVRPVGVISEGMVSKVVSGCGQWGVVTGCEQWMWTAVCGKQGYGHLGSHWVRSVGFGHWCLGNGCVTWVCSVGLSLWGGE